MKTMNKEKELLSAYIDGELSEKEKAFIESRIKISLELQKEVETLKKLKSITSSSATKLPDSPYFESRLLASLNEKGSSNRNFTRWLPAFVLGLVTIGLMVVFKYNPNLIENLIEEQKTNIAGFYKENLKPLLLAANLTNEDIFNFALYQELPLDQSDQQVLKLGYDPKGSEFFEIKKVNDVKKPDNLRNFVSALNLSEEDADKIDSILGSYSAQLSSQVLVNDRHSVAINPALWKTRQAILADIVSFTKRHGDEQVIRSFPLQTVSFDEDKNFNVVNNSEASDINTYIFFTPDSIFKDTYEFDMQKFNDEMKEVNEELAKLETEKYENWEYNFKIDTTIKVWKQKKRKSGGMDVTVGHDNVKVLVPNINMQNMVIPNLDSITIFIEDLSKNIQRIAPPIPKVRSGKGTVRVEVRSADSVRTHQYNFNVDSLMMEKRKKMESSNRLNLQGFPFSGDSLKDSFDFFFSDSLMFQNNEQLKKEMESLKKELQKFREEMKNWKQKQEKPEDKTIETKSIEI